MNLTEAQKIMLFSWGYYLEDIPHFRDSNFELDPVGIDTIRRLPGDHEFHQNALRQWQEFFSQDLDDECMRTHGRHLDADGLRGPASDAIFRLPRCGFPDKLPSVGPEEARNWPESCRMDLTFSNKPGMSLPGLSNDEIHRGAQQALDNAMSDFEIGITIEQTQYPSTNINRKPARLGGSVLADQYLATGNCGYTSNGRIDSDRNWEYWFYVTTISHENGHAYGMGHNNDRSALLYPSINRASIQRKGRFNATDKGQMRQLGYRPRTSPPPEPPGEDVGDIRLQFNLQTARGAIDVDDQGWTFVGVRK